MNYTYEIDENNAVRIWSLRKPLPGNAPSLFQPSWPDQTPWASKEEAENWAKAFIECREDETGTYKTGKNPEEGFKVEVPPKPTLDEPTEEDVV